MRKSSPAWLLVAPLLVACRRDPPPPSAPAPVPVVRDAGALPEAAPRAAAAPTEAPPPLPRGKLLTVLHASNLRGEYEAHPLGGLARRATYLAKARTEADAVVHVDAGDSLLPALAVAAGEPPPAPSEVERRARLLMEGLGRLKLDAFTPGETDLALGPAKLKALAHKARVPLVATNVVDRRGKPWFTPHRFFQAGGIRVGVFGVVTMAPADQEKAGAAGVTLTDPFSAAQGAASLLREQGAEVVIGLFHLAGGLKEAERLGGELSAIDVMVLGHGADELPSPQLVAASTEGATLIVAAGERGRFLGRLDLHLVDGDTGFLPSDRPGAAPVTGSWAAHQVVRLGPNVVSDDAMLAFVKPYIEENRRRAARKVPVGLTARAGTGGELAHGSDEGWQYASSSACAMCHKPAMDQFLTTGHAFALQTLERKGRERDPTCLACHATGFDRPGGTRNLQTGVSYFANVGCESCHGPSVNHIRAQNKTGTTRKVPEAVCRECHRPEQQMAPFDYATALKEVTGPGHGR